MNNALKAELRVTSVAHAGLSVGLEVIFTVKNSFTKIVIVMMKALNVQ